jgi:hypothetical protein
LQPFVNHVVNISFQITTIGSPVINWQSEPNNTCTGVPAAAHLMIGGYDLTQTQNYLGYVEWDRWWAPLTTTPLVAGTYSYAIPLANGYWSDVYGNSVSSASALNGQGFAFVLASPQRVGLTLGGGCFYGHGVRVALNPDGTPTGTVTIRITRFSVD